MSEARRRGIEAEHAARAYLERRGLRWVEGNYRCRGGEIDLVMRDGAVWVFVEVRYRRGQCYGGALASVDRHKQARLLTAAQHYLQRHRLDVPARIDVLALSPAEGDYRIEWIRDAIQA